MANERNISDVKQWLLDVAKDEGGEVAIEHAVALISKMQSEMSMLTLEKKRLLNEKIGRTSEKVSRAQLDLLVEMLGDDDESDEEYDAEAAKKERDALRKKRRAEKKKKNKGGKKKGRKRLPEHLPREVEQVPVDDDARTCECCGEQKSTIGYETSETLEFRPASLFVKQEQREKVACKHCKNDGVTTAPVGPRLFDKGLFGPGFVAHVLTQKFTDSMPLYRIRQRLKREDDVEVGYSTLVDYVGKAHAVLAPVAMRIREKALAADVLAADECVASLGDTGFKFLTDENETGSQRGRLWAYIGDEKWAFYAFTPTWEGKYPQAVLDEREGPVVADAYKGYDAVFKKGDAIEVGCWAHTRRYFYEAMTTGDLDAVRPLHWIQDLFLVEADLKERDADVDEVGRVRQELSRPLTDKVFKEVARLSGRVVPKSPLGRAVTYATNQREALLRFLDDGRLPLDNTDCERGMRTIACGRKNYLFAGSDEGAERAATMYTIMETCKRSGVNPWAYLKDVLWKLQVEMWPASRLDELLPPEWTA